jgi:hypothetical protein
VSEGTVTNDASKLVAKQHVKKTTERHLTAKKMRTNINILENLSNAIKLATKRAPSGSKLPKLANVMIMDTTLKEAQENKATTNRRVSPLLKQNAVKKPAKTKCSSDRCSTQPESILEGPCSKVTTPFSTEKHLVASRSVTVKEAQGGTDETARQVEKLKTAIGYEF